MPLHIVKRDITKMNTDAIVNTTNEEMTGYSGVDKAIHRGAGPLLDKRCAEIAPLGLGEVKVTPGYDLPAKYIIHTSGPVWQGGLMGESIILRSCYTEALKKASEMGLSSLSFPLISSGAYGYPKDRVLKFAVGIITEFLYTHEMQVYLCVYDKTSYQFSRELFREISEIIEDDSSDFVPSPLSRREFEYEASVPLREEMRAARPAAAFSCSAPLPKNKQSSAEGKTLQEYMKNMDDTFARKLFRLIDERGMTDVECYKKANVDKKTFSKIKCNPDTYKPSKQTAVAFAVALKLNLDETQELLASAGLTLSKSFVFDKIIRYFISKGIYDIFEINEALFEFDQVLLGC